MASATDSTAQKSLVTISTSTVGPYHKSPAAARHYPCKHSTVPVLLLTTSWTKETASSQETEKATTGAPDMSTPHSVRAGAFNCLWWTCSMHVLATNECP